MALTYNDKKLTYDAAIAGGTLPHEASRLAGGYRPGSTATPTADDPYYGSERNTDWEEPALQQQKWTSEAALDFGIISRGYLDMISSDPSLISFYVNAIAYGGYTMGDILNDMKRREMVQNGNTEAKGIKIIDPEMSRMEYQNTAEGQKAITETARLIPTFNMQGLMNPEILKYGANIPDDLFKTLVPLLDRSSPEFKEAVENVKSAFYDLANQQLQATTEQDKAVADYNYQKFKEEINKQYGIALSDDATKAWGEIENLENTYNVRGLSGSGMEREGMEDVLRTTRKHDQRLRQEKLSKEEAQMASKYSTSGTSDQIKALIDEDKAKGLPREEWRATKWGLVPSEDILSQYDLASLRTRYPDQSEQELQEYRDSVLDQHGNYRSTLYGKYYSDIAKNKQDKKTMAETNVLQDAANKENLTYRNYEIGTNTFSKATKADDVIVKENAPTITQPEKFKTPGIDAAREAAANINKPAPVYKPNTIFKSASEASSSLTKAFDTGDGLTDEQKAAIKRASSLVPNR